MGRKADEKRPNGDDFEISDPGIHGRKTDAVGIPAVNPVDLSGLGGTFLV
jgi:hypothetical protein